MAALNSWQRIDRVLTGLPWGSGTAGDATISSSPNTRVTVTGTATQTTSTVGAGTLANGDIVLLIQYVGTGVGQWEINRVASGGGTTSITWAVPLHFSYATGAQAVKIVMHDDLVCDGYTATAWDGSTGGVEVLCGKSSVTLNTAPIIGTGRGYRGGASGNTGTQGEGTSGTGTASSSANASGGGGGAPSSNDRGGGGGGGHVASGSNASGFGVAGTGGSSAGSEDLITIVPGGAGGGAGQFDGTGGAGGNTGCLVFIFTKNFTANYGVQNNGQNGYDATGGNSGGGGGGAAGSTLVVCETASLGTNLLTATKGLGGNRTNGGGTGGDGSNGRIAVHYKTSVSGSTNPTYYSQQDTTLLESPSGAAVFFMMM